MWTNIFSNLDNTKGMKQYAAKCMFQHNECRKRIIIPNRGYCICCVHVKYTQKLWALKTKKKLFWPKLSFMSAKISISWHGQTSLVKCWLTNRSWSRLGPKMHYFHIPGVLLPEWPLTNGAGQICINGDRGGTRPIRQMPLTVVPPPA